MERQRVEQKRLNAKRREYKATSFFTKLHFIITKRKATSILDKDDVKMEDESLAK